VRHPHTHLESNAKNLETKEASTKMDPKKMETAVIYVSPTVEEASCKADRKHVPVNETSSSI
jgi:hypothetical protein